MNIFYKNSNSSAIQLDLTATQSFSLLTQLKISLYGRTPKTKSIKIAFTSKLVVDFFINFVLAELLLKILQ